MQKCVGVDVDLLASYHFVSYLTQMHFCIFSTTSPLAFSQSGPQPVVIVES